MDVTGRERRHQLRGRKAPRNPGIDRFGAFLHCFLVSSEITPLARTSIEWTGAQGNIGGTNFAPNRKLEPDDEHDIMSDCVVGNEFDGQIGVFYLFDCAVNTADASSLYELGPDGIITPPATIQSPTALSAELAAHVVMAFAAQSQTANGHFSNFAPQQHQQHHHHHDTEHAVPMQDTTRMTTRSIRSVMTALQGTLAIMPVIGQLDMPTALTAETDRRLFDSFLRLLLTLCRSNPTDLITMKRYYCFHMIASKLVVSNPTHLTVKTLLLIQAFIVAASNDHKLQRTIYMTLMANINIWIRCRPTIIAFWLKLIRQTATSMPQLMLASDGVKHLLFRIARHCWYIHTPLSLESTYARPTVRQLTQVRRSLLKTIRIAAEQRKTHYRREEHLTEDDDDDDDNEYEQQRPHANDAVSIILQRSDIARILVHVFSTNDRNAQFDCLRLIDRLMSSSSQSFASIINALRAMSSRAEDIADPFIAIIQSPIEQTRVLAIHAVRRLLEHKNDDTPAVSTESIILDKLHSAVLYAELNARTSQSLRFMTPVVYTALMAVMINKSLHSPLDLSTALHTKPPIVHVTIVDAVFDAILISTAHVDDETKQRSPNGSVDADNAQDSSDERGGEFVFADAFRDLNELLHGTANRRLLPRIAFSSHWFVLRLLAIHSQTSVARVTDRSATTSDPSSPSPLMRPQAHSPMMRASSHPISVLTPIRFDRADSVDSPFDHPYTPTSGLTTTTTATSFSSDLSLDSPAPQIVAPPAAHRTALSLLANILVDSTLPSSEANESVILDTLLLTDYFKTDKSGTSIRLPMPNISPRTHVTVRPTSILAIIEQLLVSVLIRLVQTGDVVVAKAQLFHDCAVMATLNIVRHYSQLAAVAGEFHPLANEIASDDMTALPKIIVIASKLQVAITISPRGDPAAADSLIANACKGDPNVQTFQLFQDLISSDGDTDSVLVKCAQSMMDFLHAVLTSVHRLANAVIFDKVAAAHLITAVQSILTATRRPRSPPPIARTLIRQLSRRLSVNRRTDRTTDTALSVVKRCKEMSLLIDLEDSTNPLTTPLRRIIQTFGESVRSDTERNTLDSDEEDSPFSSAAVDRWASRCTDLIKYICETIPYSGDTRTARMPEIFKSPNFSFEIGFEEEFTRLSQSGHSALTSAITSEVGVWFDDVADALLVDRYRLDESENSHRKRCRLKRDRQLPIHRPRYETYDQQDNERTAAAGAAAEADIAALIQDEDIRQAVRVAEVDPASTSDTEANDNQTESETVVDLETIERSLFTTDAAVVHPTNMMRGRLTIGNSTIVFKSIADDADSSQAQLSHDFVWLLMSVSAVHFRRYHLQRTALEIFFLSGKPQFLLFQTTNEMESFYTALIARLRAVRHRSIYVRSQLAAYSRPNLTSALPYHFGLYHRRMPLGPWGGEPRTIMLTSGVTAAWQARQISNFDYLMAVNTIAGRTYNDLSQWPVFPWILADYTSSTIDLHDPNKWATTYRDLTKPVGALNPRRLAEFDSRFHAMDADDTSMPPFYYGTHYSTAASTLFYLIRCEPFTSYAVDLQDGKLDLPDRIFYSIPATWSGCMSNTADVRELIPEFFYVPDMLINGNHIHFGTKPNGHVIDDVVLPAWASSADDFCLRHMEALESEYVSLHLHHWIDLVFGYKQRGRDAVKAQNVFFHMTYEGAIDLAAIDDQRKRDAAIIQIENYGQTPTQTFLKPHAARTAAAADTSATPLVPSVLSCGAEVEKYETIAFDGVNGHIALLYHLASADRLLIIHDSRLTSHTIRQSSREYIPPFTLALTSDEGEHIDGSVFAVSPCERYVISGGHVDGAIRIINIATKELIQIVNGHAASVSALTISPRGDVLVSASTDSTVAVWSARDWSPQRTDAVNAYTRAFLMPNAIAVLTGHTTPVTALSVDIAVDSVLSVGEDGAALEHSAAGRFRRRFAAADSSSHRRCILAVSAATYVILAYTDRTLTAATLNGRTIVTVNTSSDVTTMIVSRSGACIIIGYADGAVDIRECPRLTVSAALNVSHRVTHIALTAADRLLLVATRHTGSDDGGANSNGNGGGGGGGGGRGLVISEMNVFAASSALLRRRLLSSSAVTAPASMYSSEMFNGISWKGVMQNK